MADIEQSRPLVATVGGAAAGHEPAPTGNSTAAHEAWLRSQLPLMRKVVVGLTVFFFIASAVQLAYLHFEITNAPQRDFSGVDAMLKQAQGTATSSEGLPAAALAALTTLEISAMERRYHQANLSLLSRTWTRYLGFVTGMVLAMVGAMFILGRLESPPTTLKSEASGWKFELISASPGLVLALLGVGLMLTTIVTHHEIQIQDRPIYAQGWSFDGAPAQMAETGRGKPAPLASEEPATSASQGVATNAALDETLKKLGGGPDGNPASNGSTLRGK